jgi:small subunit ribosomal protein S1
VTEPEDEDFAALFEASEKATRLEKGDTIEGTIVAFGAEVAFVNVGGKGEAVIDIDELKNDDGQVEATVGERIQATVVSTEGGLTLSRKLARGAATLRQIEDAYRAGMPVEGRVERAVKGGYEVTIAKQRAFCPFSQIDTTRNTTPADHEGHVYTFRIIEFKEDGRNLVVSRRALQEVEQAAAQAELRERIVPGAVLTGHVVSVPSFGAFVELGAGIQGLLHISEMSWTRVSDAAQVVTPGQEITVKVLRVDPATQKIALGLKQLADDPWTAVPVRYAVGQVVTGRYTRIAEFGAFVELEPGIEALAHVSTFAPTGKPGGWSKSIAAGTTGAFEILTIEPDKKRIGVAQVPEGSAREGEAMAKREIAAGMKVTGKVERHERFGVFVFLGVGRTGLIPMSETGLEKEADVAKAFPVGSDVEVIVLEVDAASRRIRLSRKAVDDAQDAAELREYAARTDTPSAAAFGGSLADKLRGALEKGKP